MRIFIELDIGERVILDKEYECVESFSAHGCDICEAKSSCNILVCASRLRNDCKDVIFKAVKE